MFKNTLLLCSLLLTIAIVTALCLWSRQPSQVAPVWQFKCDTQYPVLSLSDDGATLAVGGQKGMGTVGPGPPHGSYGGVLEAWDLPSRKRIAQKEIDEGVQSVEFIPGTREVLVAASHLKADDVQRGSVRFWSVDNNTVSARADFEADVYGATGSPDRSLVCVAIHDALLMYPQIWCGSAEALRKGEHELLKLKAIEIPIRRVGAIAFASTRQFLFASDSAVDKTTNDKDWVSIWDLGKGQRIAGIPNPVGILPKSIVTDSVNGRVAILASGNVYISDIETARYPQHIVFAGPDLVVVHCISFSKGGDTIALGAAYRTRGPVVDNGFLVLINAADLEVIGTAEIAEHGTTVNSVAFTKDGEQVLAASIDGSVRMWNVDDIVGND